MYERVNKSYQLKFFKLSIIAAGVLSAFWERRDKGLLSIFYQIRSPIKSLSFVTLKL
mgnify:CR=1 FL=1